MDHSAAPRRARRKISRFLCLFIVVVGVALLLSLATLPMLIRNAEQRHRRNRLPFRPHDTVLPESVKTSPASPTPTPQPTVAPQPEQHLRTLILHAPARPVVVHNNAELRMKQIEAEHMPPHTTPPPSPSTLRKTPAPATQRPTPTRLQPALPNQKKLPQNRVIFPRAPPTTSSHRKLGLGAYVEQLREMSTDWSSSRLVRNDSVEFVTIRGYMPPKSVWALWIQSWTNGEGGVITDQDCIEACHLIDCMGFYRESRWIYYFSNVPPQQYLTPTTSQNRLVVRKDYYEPFKKQRQVRIGCSRHRHACPPIGVEPQQGVAPCCAHVMQDVINEFARVMREEKITWIMTQGQVIALVRDGTLGLFDHDFDPYFGKDAALLARVKELVRTKMHIGGTAIKYREVESYYLLRRAQLLNTNWTRYHVCGGDFDWTNSCFHDENSLQMTSTFMDLGQARGWGSGPRKDQLWKNATFRCFPREEFDVLLPRDFHTILWARYGQASYTKRPRWIADEQYDYSGYEDNWVRRSKGLIFNEDGTLKNKAEMTATIEECLQKYPDYWDD